MKIIESIRQLYSDRPTAVMIGKFDGMHRGHQLLLSELLRAGAEEGLATIVFTFRQTAGDVRNSLLLTETEKRLRCESAGVERYVSVPFEEIRDLPAREFIEEILAARLRTRRLICGDDFRFGAGRRGGIDLLREEAVRFGTAVTVFPKLTENGREISSTRIRECVQAGRMEEAALCLGSPYEVTGTVVHGNHLGRTFGLPTINQIPDAEKLLPPYGVYASRVRIGEKTYIGATNIGSKPTVPGAARGAETYLLDTDEDLYGQTARVELLSFLRPERKFSGREELIAQMNRDVERVRQMLAEERKAGR